MATILSQSKRVFNATKSNAIISKSKNVFWFFFRHFRTLHKIWNTFKKNDEPQRLFVSEIIDSKSRSYLNAQKATYQNTDGQWTC